MWNLINAVKSGFSTLNQKVISVGSLYHNTNCTTKDKEPSQTHWPEGNTATIVQGLHGFGGGLGKHKRMMPSASEVLDSHCGVKPMLREGIKVLTTRFPLESTESLKLDLSFSSVFSY